MTDKEGYELKVSIKRDEHGIPHIEADCEANMYWGQGWCHAEDRGMQMTLMRILGQGRASELLDSSDETLGIDTFFRRMNWAGNTQSQLNTLPDNIMENLEAYCDGVNAAFANKFPWEFKLLGVKHEPWLPQDVIMMARMIGYLTLAQSQWEIERLLVEMIQANVPPDKLEELFPGQLGELDIDLLKKVKLKERIVPPEVLWGKGLPRMMASNNWVVSGKKTASGKPMVVNDPHLEVNRLPNIWMEIVMGTADNYFMGGSMPGVPGTPVGRTKQVAWGATYAFIDACDSWIEQCKDGNYYREENDQWLPFSKRSEIIKRKKKEAATVTFYENNHGVLDGDPNEEGYYLATRWAPGESGALAVIALMGMWQVTNVDEAMASLGKIESAWNFVIADNDGDIGFQMSGLTPRRRDGISGLIPVPGWKKENDWQGFLTVAEMPQCKNPKCGYFTTANQDLNQYGKKSPINMPMGSYRSDRISHLLEPGQNLHPEDMFKMHRDLYSLQGEMFMKILKPLLPDSPQGKILKEWDFNYDASSQGAFLFEQFYKALFGEVFGKKGLGEEVVQYLLNGDSIYIDFYQNLDRVLLSEFSVWFEGESRDEIFKRVAAKALAIEPKAWGEVQQFMMSHIILGGKLPRFLGFDRGPLTGIGGRATIHQGQIYKSAGRVTTFMPGYRFVIPMAEEKTYSNMAGGPLDRRFSKWYCSDLENWLNYKYKEISPEFQDTK
jgi:penicillin G amidase